MSKWETDAQDQIILNPVVGYETAPAAESSVAFRILFVSSDEQLRSGKSEAIQLVLSPVIARQMAEDLQAVAAHLSSLAPPGTRQN